MVLSIIIGSTLLFNDSTNIDAPDNHNNKVIPIESLSPTGNLTKYNVTVTCQFPAIPEKAPVLKTSYIPIENEQARHISEQVFGMSQSAELINMPYKKGIMIKDEGRLVRYFGMNRIYYSEETSPIVNEYNEQEIEQVASTFVNNIMSYWTFDTDITLELDSIKPSWTTTVEYPDSNMTEEILHAVGARYSLKVDDFKLFGAGADFSVWVANGRVVDAELHYPMIETVGYMNITRTPSEAIDNFVNGRSDVRKMGFDPLIGIIPREGKCEIKNIELVYYLTFSEETQKQIYLVYKIDATLTYIDIDEGIQVELDYSDYQIATK